MLARTLTRPLRELTAATSAMAAGNLNQRVTVRSKDEIGRLAASFNQMSSDLARASQTRKQMTADLAHDLRTPLTILRGYAEGLKEGRLQGTPTLYGIMHGEIEHLQRLVEDLRVLSLADAGELSLNRRSVDPAALLERCGLAHFQQAVEAASPWSVRLRVDAAPDLPSILVDTDRMAQVLNNLVTNALKHTSAGEVALSASAQGGRVLLSVRDSGEGIAPEHLPYVFDRFYRADSSRQRAESQEAVSSGLGLAIAKAIVEAHGGSMSVESTVGVGSTFTVSLPVSEAPPAPPGKHEAIRLPKVIRGSTRRSCLVRLRCSRLWPIRQVEPGGADRGHIDAHRGIQIVAIAALPEFVRPE
jgi:two-component system sensor histidine kinase BaeS